jgi:hypothetical protein
MILGKKKVNAMMAFLVLTFGFHGSNAAGMCILENDFLVRHIHNITLYAKCTQIIINQNFGGGIDVLF